MRVMITSASSFTGSEILKGLLAQGLEVIGTHRKKLKDYSGLPALRLQSLPRDHLIHCAQPKDWASLIHKHQIDVFIFQHFEMKNYRDFSYSKEAALAQVQNEIQLLKPLSNLKMVFSSTDFTLSKPDLPYSQAKIEAWSLLKQSFGSTAQVFIPYPIGGLENKDRLLPQVYKSIRQGKELKLTNETLSVTTPDQLTQAYLRALKSDFQATQVTVESQKVSVSELVSSFYHEVMKQRLGLHYESVEESLPLPAKELQRLEKLWDDYAKWIRGDSK